MIFIGLPLYMLMALHHEMPKESATAEQSLTIKLRWVPVLALFFFKVKVMDQVITYSHKVGPTSYRLTSFLFHVSPPIPGIQLVKNLTL